MKTLTILLLIVSFGGAAKQTTKEYIVTKETGNNTINEYVTALNKEEILKLARINAGKLYISTNKLKNGKFTSQLETVSSAYIKIEKLTSSIVHIDGLAHQKTIGIVSINNDFLKIQMDSISKVEHLTSQVKAALVKLNLQKERNKNESINSAKKRIKKARLELLNHQKQLANMLDKKAVVKNRSSGYKIQTKKQKKKSSITLDEAYLAVDLYSLWYERVIETIIMPLKEQMIVNIQSAKKDKNHSKVSDIYPNGKTFANMLEHHRKNKNIEKITTLSIDLKVTLNQKLIAMLSEWFEVSPTNELSIIHSDNDVEDGAKFLLLRQIKQIRFDSIILANNLPVAIISSDLRGEIKIAEGYQDSSNVLSLPMDSIRGSSISKTKNKKTFLLGTSFKESKLRKRNRASFNSIDLTSKNLVWVHKPSKI